MQCGGKGKLFLYRWAERASLEHSVVMSENMSYTIWFISEKYSYQKKTSICIFLCTAVSCFTDVAVNTVCTQCSKTVHCSTLLYSLFRKRFVSLWKNTLMTLALALCRALLSIVQKRLGNSGKCLQAWSEFLCLRKMMSANRKRTKQNIQFCLWTHSLLAFKGTNCSYYELSTF